MWSIAFTFFSSVFLLTSQWLLCICYIGHSVGSHESSPDTSLDQVDDSNIWVIAGFRDDLIDIASISFPPVVDFHSSRFLTRSRTRPSHLPIITSCKIFLFLSMHHDQRAFVLLALLWRLMSHGIHHDRSWGLLCTYGRREDNEGG